MSDEPWVWQSDNAPTPLADDERPRGEVTCGDWHGADGEPRALAELLSRLDACALFTVLGEREFTSQWVQPPIASQSVGRLRPDLILIPKPPLVEAGWLGAIGVEVKRSGTKAGPVIAQAIDYRRCSYSIPRMRGLTVLLEAVFIWPLDYAAGPLASLQFSQRIGSLWNAYGESLTFRFSDQRVLSIKDDGTFRVNTQSLANAGRKEGSR